jgi:uncharacterized RDD family membrane protein YckC
MNKPDYLISTPENVDLHLELAGLGNRLLAAVADHAAIFGVVLIILLFCVGAIFLIEHNGLATDAKNVMYWYLAGITLFTIFLVQFGYFIFFEGFWHGQTPGKRLLGIRVIEQNGQPVSWGAVWIRNLLRVVDELPGLLPGIIPMIADKNERRFGDLAAGTLVIRERLQSITASGLKVAEGATSDLSIDAGQIKPEEYNLITNFLRRRTGMSLTERQRLASDLSDYFKRKFVLETNSDSPELLLEKLFIAYKQRAENE